MPAHRSRTVPAHLLRHRSPIAGRAQVGDLVRATTYVTMGMSYPAWQLMLDGVGKPTLLKSVLAAEKASFETVLAAIGSNGQEAQGNGQVVLFVERGG